MVQSWLYLTKVQCMNLSKKMYANANLAHSFIWYIECCFHNYICHILTLETHTCFQLVPLHFRIQRGTCTLFSILSQINVCMRCIIGSFSDLCRGLPMLLTKHVITCSCPFLCMHQHAQLFMCTWLSSSTCHLAKQTKFIQKRKWCAHNVKHEFICISHIAKPCLIPWIQPNERNFVMVFEW